MHRNTEEEGVGGCTDTYTLLQFKIVSKCLEQPIIMFSITYFIIFPNVAFETVTMFGV